MLHRIIIFFKRFNLFFCLLNIAGCPQRYGKGYGFKEEQTQSQQEQHAQGSAIDEHVETWKYPQVSYSIFHINSVFY